MRKFLILFLTLIFSSITFSQKKEEKIYRLQQLYQKSSVSEKEIDEMLLIVDFLQERDDPDTLSYLEKIYPIIIKAKYYTGLYRYSHQIHLIYRKENRFAEAEKIVREIYQTYKSKMSEETVVDIGVVLMSILQELHKYDEIFAMSEQMLKKNLTPIRKASICFIVSRTYSQKGDYKKALLYGLQSFDLYVAQNDKMNAAVAGNILGEIYRHIGNKEKAETYYLKSLHYATVTQSPPELMLIYSNISNFYESTERPDKALFYFEKGLALSKKYKRYNYVAQNLMNMGNLYLKQNQYKKASECYNSSLKICYDYDIDYGKMLNYTSIGNMQNTVGKYMESKIAYDSAMVYVKQFKLPSEEADLNKGYSDLYRKLGKYKEALEYSDEFYRLKDEIVGEKTQKEIAELQVRYETEVKDRQIEKMQNDFKEKKAQDKFLIVLLSGAILVTGLTVFFLIYRNRSLKELYQRNLESLNTFKYVKQTVVTEKQEDEEPLRKIFDKLLEVLEYENLYKNATLSLADTAKILGTNEKYLSKAISDYSKMNYSNFINFYRINEAKRMILEEKSININEVMYACGFNSKSPFYSAFTKYTGMSPKQFKDFSKLEAVLQ